MVLNFSNLTGMNYEIIVLIKLFLSAIVGFIIGYLRRNHPAGIRTFMLISLGCTLFTMSSVGTFFGGAGDPSRIIANIVTGIGFLGVGVIWKSDNKLIGLTTATTIWVTAGIGINVGIGDWFIVFAGTILISLVLLSKKITRPIEKGDIKLQSIIRKKMLGKNHKNERR